MITDVSILLSSKLKEETRPLYPTTLTSMTTIRSIMSTTDNRHEHMALPLMVSDKEFNSNLLCK